MFDDETLIEAGLLIDEIEGHEAAPSAAQRGFVGGCRRRLAAGRLNRGDVRRLEDILDQLDHRAEKGDERDEHDHDADGVDVPEDLDEFDAHRRPAKRGRW